MVLTPGKAANLRTMHLSLGDLCPQPTNAAKNILQALLSKQPQVRQISIRSMHGYLRDKRLYNNIWRQWVRSLRNFGNRGYM